MSVHNTNSGIKISPIAQSTRTRPYRSEYFILLKKLRNFFSGNVPMTSQNPDNKWHAKPEAGMPIIQKTGKKRYVFLQFQFPGPLHFQKSDEWERCKKRKPPAVQSTVSHSISKPGLYKSQRNNVSISKEQCSADYNVVDHKIPCIRKKEHSKKQPKESDFSLPPAFS